MTLFTTIHVLWTNFVAAYWRIANDQTWAGC